jgi:hypothetical protein
LTVLKLFQVCVALEIVELYESESWKLPEEVDLLLLIQNVLGLEQIELQILKENYRKDRDV